MQFEKAFNLEIVPSLLNLDFLDQFEKLSDPRKSLSKKIPTQFQDYREYNEKWV